MDKVSFLRDWNWGAVILSILGPVALLVILPHLYSSDLPVVNRGKVWDVFHVQTKKRWRTHAANLLETGFKKSRNAFKILTDNGPLLILSPQYAREIRNHDHLSLDHFIAAEFHPEIPGFEPFKLVKDPENPLNAIIRAKLTEALAYLTQDLSAEVADALAATWTDGSEWHEVSLSYTALKVVAQMASRAFVGPEIGRDPRWHGIIITYTHNVYQASQALHLWPKALRPFVARFLPSCKALQAQIAEARGILEPLVARRRAQRAEQQAEGAHGSPSRDVVDWLEDHYGDRPYDAVAAQLLLSFAAIHGTSNLLAQAVVDLCKNPELMQDIRAEALAVLGREGWTRPGLYQLKLMDSALKESQRLVPNRLLSMGRMARTDVSLSDGLKIPKGTSLMVSARTLWDSEVYPDPLRFDGYRFHNLRQEAGHEGQYQLVSATEQHMGFGYGKHACPGRFFAAAEIKSVLCHMLVKYDLKLQDGPAPRMLTQGMHFYPDPTATILVRRRKEEICL
ncbi:hypothetical protein HIM_00195 [Hirsutella minnesotensis 3608]|nr:hypothetical protein HIM_00195 [Hirsutella minnesotensis 3608]